TAPENGARVAVPIDAGRAARVVLRAAARLELAHRLEVERVVLHEDDRRRPLHELAPAGLRGAADRQAERAFVGGLGFVEEALASRLALRRAFAHEVAFGLGARAEANGR